MTTLSPKEISKYVKSLREIAECWYYTHCPEECSYITEEEKIWLRKLNLVGISYFRPLITVSLVERLGFTGEQKERLLHIGFVHERG